MIFFTIYNLNWGQNLTLGQRNCRIFLYGICIYLVVYLILKNLQIKGILGKIYDTLFTCLIVLLISDISVMVYLYRQYFGRSITHELNPHEKDEFVYDPQTHRYTKISPEQRKLEQELLHQQMAAEFEIREMTLKKELAHLKEHLLAKEKAEFIHAEKKRTRAAKVIQTWWRRILYQPPNGRFYVAAKHAFEQKRGEAPAANPVSSS